jgi:hypothetical protein
LASLAKYRRLFGMTTRHRNQSRVRIAGDRLCSSRCCKACTDQSPADLRHSVAPHIAIVTIYGGIDSRTPDYSDRASSIDPDFTKP